MNLGLTGGIACGKSTVVAMLREHGAIIIDADQIAREVVLPGSAVLVEVFNRFGQAVRQADGSLNRKQLGEIIFDNAVAKKDLEQILHPPIRKIMRESMDEMEHKYPKSLVVVDVPLLYESGLQRNYSEVMVVYVPPQVQLERLMKRDGLSLDQAQKRLNAQMPIEHKKDLADIVINNSGTLPETARQVREYMHGKGQ